MAQGKFLIKILALFMVLFTGMYLKGTHEQEVAANDNKKIVKEEVTNNAHLVNQHKDVDKEKVEIYNF